MHPSAAFQMSPDEALAFAARSGTGHLTTVVDGRIESTVIPFHIDGTEATATLFGHISGANRQVTSIDEGAEALVIVDGPLAYVSPSLYPTKAETGKVVPTLNYVSAQLRGRLRPITSSEEFRALLAALTSRFESKRSSPWSINDAPADYIDAQMKAIRGFTLRVDEVQGVAKHSQNRPKPDQVRVRENFLQGSGDERLIAERMD